MPSAPPQPPFSSNFPPELLAAKALLFPCYLRLDFTPLLYLDFRPPKLDDLGSLPTPSGIVGPYNRAFRWCPPVVFARKLAGGAFPHQLAPYGTHTFRLDFLVLFVSNFMNHGFRSFAHSALSYITILLCEASKPQSRPGDRPDVQTRLPIRAIVSFFRPSGPFLLSSV